ncbi:HD-GYP domain-containing protein [Salicola sp. Rm-C-2C1-2]|uniref:HD-GYP domain-containing protein n=1 Tax=Salicola sp. Rm-C-2C1-2 TaxID=3141321 RepID=UPI0032E40C3E
MIKRLPVGSLRLGMFITDLNNDWIPHNQEKRRGFIRRDETIAGIQKLGAQYVYIDTAKGLDSNDAEPAFEVDRKNEAALQTAAESAPSDIKSRALDEEMGRAREVHNQAQSMVDNLMQDVKLGKAVDVAPIHDLAHDLKESVFSNPNALSALGRIREKDNYLLEHSVNLSVLMSVFGKGLGLSHEIMEQIIVGALLHDIGKILTPDEILHKPGKLSEREFQVMKEHVAHSRDILMNSEGVGELTLLTAAEHHERLDGTGYPAGLTGEEISRYGRMAAIADVYDAITADRVYHKGITPTQGLKRLLEWSGDHLDPSLVREFIRCIGIYPVGTVVLLESAKLGVVMETNPEDQRLPVLRVFYNTQFRQLIPIERLDLAAPGTQDQIVKAIDPRDHNLDVRRVMSL